MSHAVVLRRARAADGTRASRRFARAVHRYETPRAGALVGVEHEYRVIDGDGAAVDFRTLIHTLPIDGRRIDPGDRNAYRLASGLALTADDGEAEIATPPVLVCAGFAPETAALAAEGRRTLEALLPAGVHLEGYSTHVSVSAPGGLAEVLAPRYALIFGAAFAALGEGPESLGVYVRPRPGRLELCCDFVDGARLAGVVALAAGTVRAVAEALTTGRDKHLPPPLDATLLPARERFGYRLHRHAAFGMDLYATGRRAVLPVQGGGTTTLGERTEEAWRIAASGLGRALDPATRAAVGSMLLGMQPLGIEGAGGKWAANLPAIGSAWRPCPRACQRPAFSAEPVVATWDFTAYRLQGSRRAYASVPRPALHAFEQLLNAGSLDAVVSAFLAAAPSGRVLASHAQALEPGLFDEIAADPLTLLPDEYPVPTAMAVGARAGKGRHPPARPGKPGRPPDRPGKVVVLPLGFPVRGRGESPVLLAPGGGSQPAATLVRSVLWQPLAGIAAAVVLAVVVIGVVIVLDDHASDASPRPAPSLSATTTDIPGGTPVGAVTPTPQPEPGTATAPAALPSATSPGGAPVPATATPTVTLTPPPTATPTVTPTPEEAPVIRTVFCTPVDRNVPSSCQVFMGDIGPEATSFSWSAEGGTPAAGAGPTFSPVFTTAGPHTVTVTACAGSACDVRTTVVDVF